MIKLYCFGKVHPSVIGETRDLRVQWALEETSLPYRVQGLDHTGGELNSDSYSKISPFNQIPVIDDEGFILSESSTILQYLAEKSGKLIPSDFQGRTRVNQWCTIAMNSVEPPLLQIMMLDNWFKGDDSKKQRAALVKIITGRLGGLERGLEDREWFACEDFTVADMLIYSVLRGVRKTDIIEPYPRLKEFYVRVSARPSWHRTLESYSQRLGVTLADIL
jgi:glutathione S-transferase